MKDKKFKIGLTVILASAAIGLGGLLARDYLIEREFDSADVRVKIPENGSLKDIAGFYDKNNNLSEIIVRNSYAPLERGFIVSDFQAYTKENKEFITIISERLLFLS